jgi:hypothetical protein
VRNNDVGHYLEKPVIKEKRCRAKQSSGILLRMHSATSPFDALLKISHDLEGRGSDRADSVVTAPPKKPRVMAYELELDDPRRKLFSASRNFGELYRMEINGIFAGITSEYGTCEYAASGFSNEEVELAVEQLS